MLSLVFAAVSGTAEVNFFTGSQEETSVSNVEDFSFSFFEFVLKVIVVCLVILAFSLVYRLKNSNKKNLSKRSRKNVSKQKQKKGKK